MCQVTSVMSNSLRLYGPQASRLLSPWDSAGKNTGVDCRALLQCLVNTLAFQRSIYFGQRHQLSLLYFILRVKYHSVILGSSSKLQLLVSHMITRVNNQCIYSHSVPKQSFHFSLSSQYSINCMTYSTLYNKIGFMLDDLVQLQANEVS